MGTAAAALAPSPAIRQPFDRLPSAELRAGRAGGSWLLGGEVVDESGAGERNPAAVREGALRGTEERPPVGEARGGLPLRRYQGEAR